MNGGFDSWKDVLDVLLVPAVLAVMPLIWSRIQSARRRTAFENLVYRELEEAKPHTVTKAKGESAITPNAKWTDHLKKKFVHQQVFAKSEDKLEFVLDLDPDFTYLVSQLWVAYGSDDGTQWLRYLKELAQRCPEKPDIAEAHTLWKSLIESYDLVPRSSPFGSCGGSNV